MITPFVGLEFHPGLLTPALVLGVAAAGLYGVLSVSLVLTYRVSRTVGFVQGGIASVSAFLYWYLAGKSGFLAEPRMSRWPAAVLILALGAALGALYGVTVTGKRLANWPRLNLTAYSLGMLLILVGGTISLFEVPEQGTVPSLFGVKTFRLGDAVITAHQVATLLVLVALVGGLSVVLVRTRLGINIRAIADSVDTSRLVGINLARVGIGVYAFAGAVSALAGILLASSAGVGVLIILGIFLRALTVSVLGGFTSVALALAGSLLIGISETMISANVFGEVQRQYKEIVVMVLVFALVLLINRFRPIRVLETADL